MNILKKMPFTGKHVTCTKQQKHSLMFKNREDAIEQADKFIEEIIEEYGESGFIYYNYMPNSDVFHAFSFSVAINDCVEYDSRGLGHMLNDGVLTVRYDPGATSSFVTVDYRLVL